MIRVVDLSHPIASGMAGYPGLPAPRIEPHITHAASRATYAGAAEFEITRIFMVGNTGTYLDSPYHRFPGGTDIADLPLSRLVRLPGHVLEAVAQQGRPIRLEPEPSAALAGTAVLLRTGWDRYWGTSRYWRPAPYLPRPLAELLVASGVAVVGIDTWNIDDVEDVARPAHTVLLKAGIPIVEHLRGLERLVGLSFRFSAVPPPLRGAASMPVRAFAEIEDAPADA